MKVAVIDDEAEIRGVLRELFEMESYEVVEADNGATGFEVIQANRPDLIICDIRMPVMTGDELFEKLRHSGTDLEVIPFIFLSGNASEQEQLKRLKNGADNCFEKPVDFNRLAAHVNAHLSSVARVSGFVKRKLDAVASAFPQTIAHDFSHCESLITNAEGYVDVIIDAIQHLGNPVAEAKPGELFNRKSNFGQRSQSALNGVDDCRLDYIRYCLTKFEGRRTLVRSANGEELSWTLIFMVALAELEAQKIFVSDLYVSIPSAKSTINARINSLIEDDVLIKIGDLDDGRRQLLLLTDRFRAALMDHVDGSIEMIKQVAPSS